MRLQLLDEARVEKPGSDDLCVCGTTGYAFAGNGFKVTASRHDRGHACQKRVTAAHDVDYILHDKQPFHARLSIGDEQAFASA